MLLKLLEFPVQTEASPGFERTSTASRLRGTFNAVASVHCAIRDVEDFERSACDSCLNAR